MRVPRAMDMASKCARGPACSLGTCGSGAHRKSDAVPLRPRVSVPDTCAVLTRGKGLRGGSSAVRSPLSCQLNESALSSSSSVRAVVVEEAPRKVEQRHELEPEASLSALFLRDSDLSDLSLSRLVLPAHASNRYCGAGCSLLRLSRVSSCRAYHFRAGLHGKIPYGAISCFLRALACSPVSVLFDLSARAFDASHHHTGLTGLEEPAGSSLHVLLAQRQHKGDGKGNWETAGELQGAVSRAGEGRLPAANGSAPELPGCSPAVQQHALGAVLQSRPPPVAEKKDGLGGDYHVNVGYAIRTLREELPTLFYKEMSYDIFRCVPALLSCICHFVAGMGML